MSLLHGETLRYDTEKQQLVLLDQTLLPNETKILELTAKEDMFEAIQTLKVRGAPAIGVAAAIGLSVLAAHTKTTEKDAFQKEFFENATYLAASRPTAVNLFWAIDAMKATFLETKENSIYEIKAALQAKAIELHQKDIEGCRKIGEWGATLLKDGDQILTHCNAGRLATVQYGTALAPVYVAKEQGKQIHVFADETRPLLQGARLTAYELTEAGIATTVLCDNMASYLMQHEKLAAVFVGCDRVAKNGDTANKIGTSGVAVLAKHYGIPFYVCAPFSTIDLKIETGKEIPIEKRNAEEVRSLWYEKPMIPKTAGILNPAFDVTDHSLITGFITEKGILQPPFARQ